MPTLLINWQLDLIDHDSPFKGWMEGLCFHRWLPDGKDDALEVNLNSDAHLKLWLERTGYVDGSFIQFDKGRCEVDPEIIPRQGLLVAGPILGTLELRSVSSDEADSLVHAKTSGEEYRALARRVAKLVGPPLARFVSILRTNYGQHWITDFSAWDSRRMDLASFCTHLRLQWSLDRGSSWKRLLPDYDPVVLRGGGRKPRDFLEYLTHEDWTDLGKVLREGDTPPLAARLLARTRILIDRGDVRSALIEGVTSLEVALNTFVRDNVSTSRPLQDSLGPFWELKLPVKLAAVAVCLGVGNPAVLELTLEAIHMRNRIVHEGWEPDTECRFELTALVATVTALLPGPGPKRPAAILDNWLKSPEEWEQAIAQDQQDRSPFRSSRATQSPSS